jgi:hypothetical protein
MEGPCVQAVFPRKIGEEGGLYIFIYAPGVPGLVAMKTGPMYYYFLKRA